MSMNTNKAIKIRVCKVCRKFLKESQNPCLKLGDSEKFKCNIYGRHGGIFASFLASRLRAEIG